MAKSVEVNVKVNVNLNFDMTSGDKSKDIYWQVRNSINEAIKAATNEPDPHSDDPVGKSDSPEIKLGETTYSRPRFSSTHDARVDACRRISTVVAVIDTYRRKGTHRLFCDDNDYVKRLDNLLVEIKSILLSPDFKLDK